MAHDLQNEIWEVIGLTRCTLKGNKKVDLGRFSERKEDLDSTTTESCYGYDILLQLPATSIPVAFK